MWQGAKGKEVPSLVLLRALPITMLPESDLFSDFYRFPEISTVPVTFPFVWARFATLSYLLTKGCLTRMLDRGMGNTWLKRVGEGQCLYYWIISFLNWVVTSAILTSGFSPAGSSEPRQLHGVPVKRSERRLCTAWEVRSTRQLPCCPTVNTHLQTPL